jgi:hypothetical protein
MELIFFLVINGCRPECCPDKMALPGWPCCSIRMIKHPASKWLKSFFLMPTIRHVS